MNKTKLAINRLENKIIRTLYFAHAEFLGKISEPRYYNDLRTNGRRRVFKVLDYGLAAVWKKVLQGLEEAGIKGWSLWTGTAHGACPAIGIRKHELS